MDIRNKEGDRMLQEKRMSVRCWAAENRSVATQEIPFYIIHSSIILQRRNNKPIGKAITFKTNGHIHAHLVYNGSICCSGASVPILSAEELSS